jgi:hypothetical protein
MSLPPIPIPRPNGAPLESAGEAASTAQGRPNDRQATLRRIGPALVLERLWEETGCRAVIAELADKRKHDFELERAV